MIKRSLQNGSRASIPYICSQCLLRDHQAPLKSCLPLSPKLFYATSKQEKQPNAVKVRLSKQANNSNGKRIRKDAAKRKVSRKVSDLVIRSHARRLRTFEDLESKRAKAVRHWAQRVWHRLKKANSKQIATNRKDEKPPATLDSIGTSLKKSIGTFLENSQGRKLIKPNDLSLNVMDIDHVPIPKVKHGIEKALFNPGVYEVRDQRSRVYNFDPSVEELMSVKDFDFNSLSKFMTASKDARLEQIARDAKKKYIGSTSSMTGVLKHFHLLLSRWRPIKIDRFSRSFKATLQSFTVLSRSPDAIFLRYKNGVYAVDADKQYDSPNVLSLMGKYMEKLLTVDKEEFELHRRGKSHLLSEKSQNSPEAYHYSTMGDFLLRSQLDAHDPRLPGTGVFDLKTRAVAPIRFSSSDFEWGTDWEIWSRTGEWTSYEREYYDMIRSTMLKYSLQVRMGRMDGILVAYHNIKRIFGFQYISLNEMDESIHGQSDTCLGDQEFLISLKLMNQVFDRATQKFPQQSIRLHFESRETSNPFMYVFAEPVTEEAADSIQATNSEKIAEWEKEIMGLNSPTKVSEDTTEVSQATPINTDDDVTSDIMTIRSKPETTSKEANPKGFTSMRTQSLEAYDRSSRKLVDTNSSGDVGLLSKLAEETSEKPGPVLGFVLTIQSSVNGFNVGRPQNPFKKEDNWEVHYSLAEIDKDARAWTLLKACKERRKIAMEGVKKKQEEGEDGAEDPWINMLKKLAEKSKERRKELDAIDAVTGASTVPRMWNEDPGSSSRVTPPAQEKAKDASLQIDSDELRNASLQLWSLAPASRFAAIRSYYTNPVDGVLREAVAQAKMQQVWRSIVLQPRSNWRTGTSDAEIREKAYSSAVARMFETVENNLKGHSKPAALPTYIEWLYTSNGNAKESTETREKAVG